MYNVSPVIHEASSDAKKATAGAIFFGRPILPRGVSASICFLKSLSLWVKPFFGPFPSYHVDKAAA